MLFSGTADLVDSNQYLYVTNLGGSINTYTKGVNVSFTGLANTAAVCLINVTDASTFQVGDLELAKITKSTFYRYLEQIYEEDKSKGIEWDRDFIPEEDKNVALETITQKIMAHKQHKEKET